jgi:hypothetical protein
VIQDAKQRQQIGTISANFDPQRALPWRRQTVFRRHHRSNTFGQPEALEARGSKNNRGISAIVEFFQPRLQIAAQRLDHQMGIAPTQLAFAPLAGGTDDTAGR